MTSTSCKLEELCLFCILAKASAGKSKRYRNPEQHASAHVMPTNP